MPSIYTALISPSPPLLFILFSASLCFLSSVWRPSFLFQPLSSSHHFPQLAPSFLSFFFPSFSALCLEFLFSLPSPLSSTRTSPSATGGTKSARGREKKDVPWPDKTETQTPHLSGDQSLLLHLQLHLIHRYQLCGLLCIDGKPNSGRQCRAVQRLETLSCVLASVLWNPKSLWEWVVHPHPDLLLSYSPEVVGLWNIKIPLPLQILSLGCHQKAQLRPCKSITSVTHAGGRDSSSSWRGQSSNVLPHL